MPKDSLRVSSFTQDHFFQALSNEYVSPEEAEERPKANLIFGYLTAIGAATIVEEFDYIDGDYLDDYTAYYAKCFKSYGRRCKRIHFFRSSVETALIVQASKGESNAEEVLQREYLGFIVVRPLPDAIVGRSVLATYDSDGGRRCYPCTKEYKANLFGLSLSIRSLAYQEQDTVLAACATVSLWSAFHKTAELFGTPTPTPSKITESASQLIHLGRPIPSRGLDFYEMGRAVRQVGLEPEIFQVAEDLPLISLMCGYLNMGLPVILGLEVEGVGRHAVTVVGYSIQNSRVRNQEGTLRARSIPMAGLRIDKFFAHDDPICPFSRISVQHGATVGSRTYPASFSGWTELDGTGGRRLLPEVVLIPVYNKIRLTFLDVQQWATRFHTLLALISKSADSFEWEIALTTSNEYKFAIRAEPLDPNTLERLLFQHHPRFIWRATLRNQGLTLVDFLFDATDMTRSFPLYEVVWYHSQFKQTIAAVMSAPVLDVPLAKVLTRKFRDRLKESLPAPA